MKLGKDYCYTQQVDEFLKTLDPSIESILTKATSNRLLKPKQRCDN